jgi:hypothetical protein
VKQVFKTAEIDDVSMLKTFSYIVNRILDELMLKPHHASKWSTYWFSVMIS